MYRCWHFAYFLLLRLFFGLLAFSVDSITLRGRQEVEGEGGLWFTWYISQPLDARHFVYFDVDETFLNVFY